MLRLGLVDCDTSHVVEFTRRLNHIDVPEDQWVEGASIVAAIPGTSLISPERITPFVDQLRAWGVSIVDRTDDLYGRVDAVLLTSVDGSVHVERALPIIEAGIPLFIDKPFTTSTADARRLTEAAGGRGLPFTSASALRYALEIQDLQCRSEEVGPIMGVDVYGPAILHPRNPGLFHYGVHAVETLYALMGTGCKTVRCLSREGTDVVVGSWEDGRLGTVRGTRRSAYAYGFTAFGEKEVTATAIDSRFIYRELLKVIVTMLETQHWPLSAEELIEPIAFQEASNLSAQRGGEEVEVRL